MPRTAGRFQTGQVADFTEIRSLQQLLPILALQDSEIEGKLIKADERLEFSETVLDILEYLGNIEPLELDELQKNNIREWLKTDIARH